MTGHDRIRSLERASALLVAPLALAVAVAGGAAAHAASPQPGSDRTAAVQAMLDRVLGPGGAVVQVTEQRRTSSGTRTRTAYGLAATADRSSSTAAGRGFVRHASVQQNLVGSTTTTTATPAGTLLRETVTVAVDRSRSSSTSVGVLRRLIAAAAGVVPARGDRVVVLLTRLPASVAVRPASERWSPADFAVPGLWTVGGLAAVLLLVVMLRRRPVG